MHSSKKERRGAQFKKEASFLNCAPLRSFFEECIVVGRRNYVVDFQECSSMDSTFLGILVGLANPTRMPRNVLSMLLHS